MMGYKEDLQAYKELKVRVDRVKEILLVRLPAGYKEDFGAELQVDLVKSYLQEKLAELKKERVLESFRHLSEADMLLAMDYVFGSKKLVEPKAPAKPKPAPVVKPKPEPVKAPVKKPAPVAKRPVVKRKPLKKGK